jgi:hypothetical protein
VDDFVARLSMEGDFGSARRRSACVSRSSGVPFLKNHGVMFEQKETKRKENRILSKKILRNALTFILVGLLLPVADSAQLGKRTAKDHTRFWRIPDRIERLKTAKVMSRLD